MKSADELADMYRLEARETVQCEAGARLEKHLDPKEEKIWKSASLRPLVEEGRKQEVTRALLSRLGLVRAALIDHDGGIEVTSMTLDGETGMVDVVINLTGGCVACGAAPGTLQSMVQDLNEDPEICRVRFDSAIRTAQRPLIQEFLDQATGLEFVER
ncbi:MAG TPA: NifU family protein [Candidatus Poseidoniales archaeon]|nr:NifU family protein [Candidatus Poseidoniales archaeon]